MNKLKITLLIFIVFGIYIKGSSQGFEGFIKYKLTIVKSEPAKISDERLEVIRNNADSISILYLKGSKYKLVTLKNGTDSINEIRLFDPKSDREYVYWENNREFCVYIQFKPNYKPKLIKRNIDSVEILGVYCISNSYDYRNNKIDIFYSKKNNIEKDAYAKHPYGYLNYFYSTGALPLRMILNREHKGFNLYMTAVEIKKEQLSDSIFEVPNFENLIKSPF